VPHNLILPRLTSRPDLVVFPPCPNCSATLDLRNGTTASGEPTFRGRPHRRFLTTPQKGPVSEEKRSLVRLLLDARAGLRAISRAAGMFRSRLQGFVLSCQTTCEPEQLKKSPAR
jgi:hypothetical protein